MNTSSTTLLAFLLVSPAGAFALQGPSLPIDLGIRGVPGATLPARDQAVAPQLPLSFVENQGQWTDEVRFVARRGPLTVFLSTDGMVIQAVERGGEGGLRGMTTRVTFEGATADPTLVGLGPQVTRRHYFSEGQSGSHRDVGSFDQVLYSGLYPGIDLRLREAAGRIEYDLLLEPGADLDQVTFRCEGIEELALADDGSLTMKTAVGPLNQSAPTTWSVLPSGETEPLDCRFRLLGEGRYGFVTPDRDPAHAVVIDPGLEWSTLYGGSDGDVIVATREAPDGTVLVAGATLSADLPTTLGAFDTTFESDVDAMVACFSADGSTLLWASYLNGPGIFDEYAFDLATSATGEVIVVGATESPNFPVTSDAYQGAFGGGVWDGFVSKLSFDGSTLLYSSFLGGTGGEWPTILELSSDGEVTIAGTVNSTDLPVTADAFQPTKGGGRDYFVVQMDLDRSPLGQLRYSTYLGGTGNESWGPNEFGNMAVMGLVVGENGIVSLCGLTRSADFPVTPDAYQPVAPNNQLSFLACIDPSVAGAGGLQYGTFLGGSELGGATDLARHPSGAYVLSGYTFSNDFPTTTGALQETFLGPDGFNDGYLVLLDPSQPPASQLAYSTFLSDEGFNALLSCAALPDGRIIAAGGTGEEGQAVSSFPVTCAAHQYEFGGGFDCTVLLLNPAGNGLDDLQYASFLGGSELEEVREMFVIADAAMPTIVAATLTTGGSYPTTTGAFQESYGGGEFDGGLFRLTMNPHTYCVAAPNSYSNSGARICGTGSTSVSANDLVLGVRDAAPSQPGLFYFGPNALQLPFGNGFRCVGGMVTRLGPPQTTNAVGLASRPLDLTTPPVDVIRAGSIWNFQFWYRDPVGGGSGFNLSNGLRVLFLP